MKDYADVCFLNTKYKLYTKSTGKCSVFFHPDYTVGTVIATVRAIMLADFTADREFHPALKSLQRRENAPNFKIGCKSNDFSLNKQINRKKMYKFVNLNAF